MAKQFQSRISKRNRQSIDLTDRLGEEIFSRSDRKLLEGALLDKIKISDIIVKEQVRTKFNDGSIRELAKNIQANGLIQPLVVHRTGFKYTLVCGERRYRALNLIEMQEVSCYILQNKTNEELMAIQFSENSSREALHYIDKANGILNYKTATDATERKIQSDLGISKSDVHRSLLIAKMPDALRTAAKTYDVEKYVLLEFDALADSELKKKIERQILIGEVTKRSELKAIVRNKGVVVKKAKIKQTPLSKKNLSANAFIKMMNSRMQDMNLDEKNKKLLGDLMEQSRDMADM